MNESRNLFGAPVLDSAVKPAYSNLLVIYEFPPQPFVIFQYVKKIGEVLLDRIVASIIHHREVGASLEDFFLFGTKKGSRLQGFLFCHIKPQEVPLVNIFDR